MALFDGVVLGSFVAQVRGIRFYDFGVSGTCRGESVVVGRRPDNVHVVNCLDVALVRHVCCVQFVWHSRLSTSQHSITPCLHHTGVVCIGQLKLVNNSFFQHCTSAVLL